MAGERKRILSSTEKECSLEKKDRKDSKQEVVGDTEDTEIFEDTFEGSFEDTNMNSNMDMMKDIQAQLCKLNQLDIITSDITAVKTSINAITKSLDFSQKSIDSLQNRIRDIQNDLKQSMEENIRNKREIEELKHKNKELEERVIKQELYSRRENIIVSGLPEDDNEKCHEKFQSVMEDLGIDRVIPLQRCHRLGVRKPNQVSPQENDRSSYFLPR